MLRKTFTIIGCGLKYIIFLTSFLLSLIVVEIGLRCSGKVPGYFTGYQGFQAVDSLVLYENYKTDEFGNYVVGDFVRDSLIHFVDDSDCSIDEGKIAKKVSGVDGMDLVIKDFCRLVRDEQSMMFNYQKDLKALHHHDQYDSSFLRYVKNPFNAQGFRSIEFNNHRTDKLKVLLLVIRLLWGMGAEPIYNSFADLLITKGYAVYNSGIISVDPAQYASVLLNYYDEIRPDVVVVNFFEGNDIMSYSRTPSEGEPHEHITNAGFLFSLCQWQLFRCK